MPGWAWAVVCTRMATVRACAAAAGGAAQSAAGSPACRRCLAREVCRARVGRCCRARGLRSVHVVARAHAANRAAHGVHRAGTGEGRGGPAQQGEPHSFAIYHPRTTLGETSPLAFKRPSRRSN
eukprot:scaffold11081_cov61-Phaeocystis_antarctica.AAC.2